MGRAWHSLSQIIIGISSTKNIHVRSKSIKIAWINNIINYFHCKQFRFTFATLAFLIAAMGQVWGQTSIDNGTSTVLNWDAGTSWNGGVVPNLAADNLNIQIIDDMSRNSAIVFTGTNKPSVFRVASGKTLTIKGDLNFQHGTNGFSIETNAKIIVEGNLNLPNGSTASIAAGGSLVVYGSATVASNMGLNGNFLVSGNLTYSGNALTVNSGGAVIVGGNYTVSNDVSLNNGGFIGVFGNMNKTGGNFNNGSGGELVVLGTVTGCTTCNQETALENNDPVWNILWGINSIYWEDFTVANTKGGYQILGGYGSVVGEQYVFNNATVGLNAVVWQSNNKSAGCNENLKVTYNLGLTNGGAGTVAMQYSVDNGVVWLPLPVGNFTARQIALRLVVNNLPNGANVTLDNIHISGTNEGGTPPDPIVFIDESNIETTLCPPDTKTYAIDNDNGGSPRYTSILWTATGGNIIGSNNTATCTVEWITLPGQLSVAATGGSCGGGITTPISRAIAIAKSENLVLRTTVTPISCNNANDGAISVLGVCGPDNGADLVYTWGPIPVGVLNPGNATSASNLPAGNYTINVTKGTGQSDTKIITLINPAVLSVSLSDLNNYLCPGHDGEGSFTVVPTGGTAPYTVVVKKEGVVQSNPADLKFINLGVGSYTIDIEDAHGCTVNRSLTIQIDNEDPVFTNFPVNVQYTNAAYNLGNASGVTVLSIANQTYNGVQNNVIVFTSDIFSLARYHNARLTFGATQGGSSWTNAHYLKAEVSVNNGSSWTEIFNDNNTLNSATVTAPLGAASDLKKQVLVRFTVNLASGLSYSLTNVKVVADEQVHILPVSTGGGHLIACSDNSGSCATPTYIDSDPIWSGSCTSYANGEFRVERVWTTSDSCRSVSQTQYLSVGTAPVFTVGTFPANLNLDFCHNVPTVTAPTATDACGTATVSWAVKDSDGHIIKKTPSTSDDAVGTGNLSGITFPADPTGNADKVYTVTWTATDEAHVSFSANQTVTIKPVIVATYTYDVSPDANDILNTCIGQAVEINIVPKGGTGNYTYSNFVPAVSGTAPVVSTIGLTQAQNKLNFRVTDVTHGVVTGGCEVNLETDVFTVHENIGTGNISRNP